MENNTTSGTSEKTSFKKRWLEFSKSEDVETNSFNESLKFAVIVYAVIEAVILALIIWAKLSR